MSSRLAVTTVIAALVVVACGPTPAPTAPASAPASPSASPDGVLPIDDASYLAGNSFRLPVGETGADWTPPSTAPVMPNGQAAVRVAFLPASCAAGSFTITMDAAPDDEWETQLQEDGTEHGYTFGSWPAAQVPECAGGQNRSYLQVAYHPFPTDGPIHIVASLTNTTGAPDAVDVVPVFTSADASQPSITASGFEALGPIPGPEKPRGATATVLAAVDFVRTILPDGTTPTLWGYLVTGCGPVGRTPIVLTARVGTTKPVEVGTCSDGSFTSAEMSLPLPADGTRVALLMAGGTTKTQVRVSEFQWRGDRH